MRLFGQEFCRIDVLPATDKIYIFKYADSARDVPIARDVTERYLPIDFLKNFNIVDTPGTNTIVASHQDITTSFVPLADLIIFVFSVVNPWAASAWDFLRYAGSRVEKEHRVRAATSRSPNPGRSAHRSSSIWNKRFCRYSVPPVQFSPFLPSKRCKQS